MHEFPDERRFPDQYQEWVRFCEREPDWRPSSQSHLCADHFDTSFKVFKTKPLPTIPAKSIENLELPTSNLPLDTTLELLEEGSLNRTLTFSPSKTGLPADRTLDTTLDEFDIDSAMISESYENVDLCLANIALVRIPSKWALVMYDSEIVLFTDVNKITSEITRSVGFNTTLGKSPFLSDEYKTNNNSVL